MGDLGITKVVVLHCDNQSAIMLAQNPVFHAMTHIQVRYHFIIDVIDSKRIEFVSVQIDDNPTDLLMKGLPAKHNYSLMTNMRQPNTILKETLETNDA